MKSFVLICLMPLLFEVACTQNKNSGGVEKTSATSSLDDLITKGRRLYENHCISCHAPQPDVAGAVGPAIAGSSKELIEARILTATYPAGYTPKRTTKVMPAMPYLKRELDAITAYLQSVQPK